MKSDTDTKHLDFPMFKVHVDVEAALVLLKDVLSSGFLNEGSYVSRLTDAFKDRMGTTNITLMNSCTSTLITALRLSGVRPWDEVISTPMTCVATNCAIASLGADIVWADIDPTTGCTRSDDVKKILFERPNTKAVIVVAWAGIPPELDSLANVCKEANVKLILDAAHAMDATFKGKHVHEWKLDDPSRRG